MQVFVQTLVGGLGFGAIYSLVAMGFSIVYRTMGLVNFAHGDIVMIGAFIAATAFMSSRLPFALAVLIAIALTAAIGLVIERVLRPLENRDLDLMLIGTIGFGIVLEAVATLIWGATGRAVRTPVGASPIKVAGIYIQPYDLLIITLAAVAAAGSAISPAPSWAVSPSASCPASRRGISTAARTWSRSWCSPSS